MDEALFWQAVSGATAAAAIAGGFASWLISSWVQRRNKPEADWALNTYARANEISRGNDPDEKRHFIFSGTISNAGDAPAFRVTMTSPTGDIRFLTGPTSPSGGRSNATVIAALRTGEQAEFSETIELDAWDTFEITIDWIISPTRLKKHAQLKIRPSELHERPKDCYLDANHGWVEENI